MEKVNWDQKFFSKYPLQSSLILSLFVVAVAQSDKFFTLIMDRQNQNFSKSIVTEAPKEVSAGPFYVNTSVLGHNIISADSAGIAMIHSTTGTGSTITLR